MSRPSLVSLLSIKLLARPMLLAMSIIGLSGCGGSEADSGTQAAASGDQPAGEGSGYNGPDYGGEGGYGGEPDSGSGSGGGAYGGGAYGGGSNSGGRGSFRDNDMNAGSMGGDYSGGGYGGEGYEGGMSEGGYGPGYDSGMAGYNPGYAGEGYGGGMSGYGGVNANPQFGTMIQFIRQNCVQCHGPQLTKGDVRLDRLTGNFEDQRNATLWSAVLEQLESGQMPPKAIPRRPDPRQQQSLVSWIKTSLSGAGFVPLDEQDYRSQAEYAFASGKEREAVDLVYAHAIVADDEVAKEFLSQAKWSTVGLRPALTLRFAVGVILTASDDLQDLKPLGSSQGGGGGGGEYGGGSFGGGRAGANSGSERTFQQLTGSFGEALATKFENRWASGSLGTVFKDIEESQPEPAAGMGQPGFGPGYAGGGYSGGGYSGGGFGGGEGSGYGGEGMGGSTQSKRTPVSPGSNITQGLFFIGTGNQAELLAKAAELKVDGLFIFDVKAEQNRRRGYVENDTRLRLLSLDGKALAATSTLNNVEIERNKMRGIEDDSLDKNIDRCFAMFDEKVRLDSMPSLKPEHAQSRMRQLLIDKNTSNLSKLFEARLYHSMGLLNTDELSMLYQIVLRGNEGIALANGTVDDRRLVLGEILTN